MTQKEYIGTRSIFCLGEVLSEFGSKKIFLVTGKKSFSTCGAEARLDSILKGYEVHRFCDFALNPNIEDIERGIRIFKELNADTVIAVGGGSVIDMAKAVNFLAAHPLALDKYEIENAGHESSIKPLIAMPTTSGSGSEATHFAVIYIGHKKHSLVDKDILPAAAIVDSELTLALPKHTTAVSGLDALCQAIESFWSVNSCEESKEFARLAIGLIMPNIVDATRKQTAAAREAMAHGAHLAGKAINITMTTAAHAVSYPLTSYFSIPHGHAVALTLPSLLEYNAQVTQDDVLDVRGVPYVQKTMSEIAAFFSATTIQEAKNKLERLIKETGLETRLNALGIKSDDDIELIIRNGFNRERVCNNPRLLTEGALRKMLHSIL